MPSVYSLLSLRSLAPYDWMPLTSADHTWHHSWINSPAQPSRTLFALFKGHTNITLIPTHKLNALPSLIRSEIFQ